MIRINTFDCDWLSMLSFEDRSRVWVHSFINLNVPGLCWCPTYSNFKSYMGKINVSQKCCFSGCTNLRYFSLVWLELKACKHYTTATWAGCLKLAHSTHPFPDQSHAFFLWLSLTHQGRPCCFPPSHSVTELREHPQSSWKLVDTLSGWPRLCLTQKSKLGKLSHKDQNWDVRAVKWGVK